jgi:hypothetical protein
MTILEEYCNDQQCTREDHKLLHSIDKKFSRNPKKFLLTEDEVVYQKISKDIKDEYTKRDTLRFIKKYKKDLLEEIESVVDLTKIDDDTLLEIEKKNKLKKYTLLDKKLYFISGAYKVYGAKVYSSLSKILKQRSSLMINRKSWQNVQKNHIIFLKIVQDIDQKVLLTQNTKPSMSI